MQLFLDMDGVLADFDKRAREIFGMEPHTFEETFGTKKFWSTLLTTEDLFNSFDPMPDAFDLWNATKHLNPTVLTGVPRGDWAAPQKRTWIARHLGEHVPVITCFARQKALHCKPGDVLVDDRPKFKDLWEKAGGTFVVHTSAAKSLDELKVLGII